MPRELDDDQMPSRGALHQHPYGAVGVAMTAGLVIGFQASRR